MTLIISTLTHWEVFQVSDRLLTRAERRMGPPVLREFDRAANKSVVLHTPDALVAISYSGLAYLNGLPFDQCLAQWTTGQNLQVGVVGHIGSDLRLSNLHHTVVSLQKTLAAALGSGHFGVS